MRLVIIPQCDYVDEIVGALEDKGYELLILSTRKVEVRSQKTTTLVQSTNSRILNAAIAEFEPDATIIFPYVSELKCLKVVAPIYTVTFGASFADDFHVPEFIPIWRGESVSRLTLSLGQREVGVEHVVVDEIDTAITLRAKHLPAAIRLLLKHIPEPKKEPSNCDLNEYNFAHIPFEGKIQPKWSDEEIERFIRAMTFPPHEPAIWEENGESFYLETFQQYTKHISGRLDEEEEIKVRRGCPYAADTHWYSNVGGTVIKSSRADAFALRKRNAVNSIPGQAMGEGVKSKLRMNEPLIGLSAERYCASVIKSGWLGVEGPMVKKFESMMARICGCNAAVAVNSGTAALYGAMKALYVSEPSHHVICPAFTCAACADAVVHAGGTPIIADCELDSFGLCFESVQKLMTPSTVGVIIAPCYGVPSRDHLKIRDFCQSRGIWLCEDNCESYGSLMPSKEGGAELVPVGSLSTMSVISVRSEKMVGVGEGGVILSQDGGLIERARWWCSRAPCRGVGLWRVYEHEAVGQNFRLPEMLAAIGIAGAENLPLMMQKKRLIRGWYKKYIKFPVTFQRPGERDEPCFWVNTIILPSSSSLDGERVTGDDEACHLDFFSAEEVGMKLMEMYPHIETRPAFYPLNQMAPFQPSQECPNAELLYDKLLCLPSSAKLEEEDVKEIAAALQHTIEELRKKK